MLVLYVMTVVSFIAIVCIIFVSVSKIPSISDKKFMSLTGNVVLNFTDNFNVGDHASGKIVITREESNAYGILSLTKDGKTLAIKTFNLKELPKIKLDSGEYSIEISDLIDYTFEEKGNYELFFSVLDLDINIKKELIVN